MRWTTMKILMLAMAAAGGGRTAPVGAVLMKSPPAHLAYDKVSSEDIGYYGVPRRGPLLENKYAAYRYQVVASHQGTIDSFQKRNYAGILNYYDDPAFDKDVPHPFGADVLHAGSSLGIGGIAFREAGKSWIMAPKVGETDSIVVQVLDSSVANPKVRIGYHGWRLGATTATVIVTLQAKWESRVIQAEMKMTGNFNGEVATGITKSTKAGITLIQDQSMGLLASLGKQTELNDSLLLAVSSGPKYFASFTTITNTTEPSIAIILKPDSDGMVKWEFLSSWQQEPQPFFRDKNWMAMAFPVQTTGLTGSRTPDSPRGQSAVHLVSDPGSFSVKVFQGTRQSGQVDSRGRRLSATGSIRDK